jgi:NADH-quinone oxidoreductase subunit J
MSSTQTFMNAPLMPWYITAAIGAAGLLMVLRPGRSAIRRAGAVIGLAGFGMLMAEGLKLAGPADGAISTPFMMAFAAVGVIGAVRVVTHPRPVFAAIYFILTVLAAAATFLVLDAEFLAFALIIVYAGAILITYLFVLMLAQQSPEDEIGHIGTEDYDRIPREPFVAVLLGFFLMASLGSAIERGPELARENAATASARLAQRKIEAARSLPRLGADLPEGANSADSVSNVQMVGLDLVAKYPASLELAGVVLLMAMFGAVVLARRQIELGEDERRKAAGLGGMVLDVPEQERGGA